MKRCARCQETKPLDDFYKNRTQSQGVQAYCKPCWKADIKARLDGPDREKMLRWRRSGHLVKKYGITADEFDAIVAAQGGGCAICGRTEDRAERYLCVDHCHDTGRVRGGLCSPCNQGMGQFAHDPALLRAAAEYLERAH